MPAWVHEVQPGHLPLRSHLPGLCPGEANVWWWVMSPALNSQSICHYRANRAEADPDICLVWHAGIAAYGLPVQKK
jgi:hypothetical protein